jgi:hypothetical protein
MIRSENRRKRPKFEKFPVKFPVSREFDPETGSPLTGSSATNHPDACLNFAAACASLITITSSSWRLRPEAEKIAAPVPQHMAVNLIALKVHEGGVLPFARISTSGVVARSRKGLELLDSASLPLSR